MSANERGMVETLSTTSSTAQGSSERPAQGGASRWGRPNRPRKPHHGSLIHATLVLTLDRPKPQNTNGDQSRPPRTHGKLADLAQQGDKGSEPEVTQTDIDSEGELCFICGNSMNGRYYSLAPCNNAFCHVCSLRLRALYKSTNCPFCKVIPILGEEAEIRLNMKPSSSPAPCRNHFQNTIKNPFRIKIQSWEYSLRQNKFGKIRYYY